MGELQNFCRALDRIAGAGLPTGEAAARAAEAMAPLLQGDAWLPEPWAAPSPERYQQHLLYCDPQGRFSVVSFVWGPGQRTPIHDHGGLWGVVGVLRGAENSTRYARRADGSLAEGERTTLMAGMIDILDPATGDIHAVDNALPDAVSVSIHAYGGDIGTIERSSFDADGTAHRFVSRYSAQGPMLEALH